MSKNKWVSSSSRRAALALAAAAAAPAVAPAGTVQGPSSSETSYLEPLHSNRITFHSIVSSGDAVGTQAGPNTPYRYGGIPDGLGAFDNGDGTFTVLSHHELSASRGVPRRHNAGALPPDAAGGAYVSRLVVSKQPGSDFLRVLSARDQDVAVNLFDGGGYSADPAYKYSRLCSADLADPSAYAFTDGAGNTFGTRERIFTGGEETSDGRAFAHVVSTGQAFELPRLGRYSFENVVASPFAQKKTVVAGMDDSDRVTGITAVGEDRPSEVYFYVGTKTNSSDPIEAAGLNNGQLFGVKVDGVFGEDKLTGIGAPSKRFSLSGLGDTTGVSDVELQQRSIDQQVTQFQRVEDGAWDPTAPSDYYFTTTDEFDDTKLRNGGEATEPQEGEDVGRTRLWRLRFDDITNPEAGGLIEAVLDGTEPIQMLDNLDVDKFGNVLMQEDPGNTEHNAKIWHYDPDTDTLTLIGQHDAAKFGAKGLEATEPFTQDEESSGIVDVSEILGDGWYLLDVQAHRTGDAVDGEIAEKGQLLAMNIPSAGNISAIPLPGAVFMAPLGAAVAGFAHRRMRRGRDRR